MIDISDTVRDYLLTVPAVTTLTASRIYAERDVPPLGYKPTDGRALVLKVRGGSFPFTQGSTHLRASLQSKCYGETEAQANDLYLVVVDTLQDIRPGAIAWVGIEILGQTLEEPDTGWPFVLFFFNVIAARSGV